jgi:hypothetical protein
VFQIILWLLAWCWQQQPAHMYVFGDVEGRHVSSVYMAVTSCPGLLYLLVVSLLVLHWLDAQCLAELHQPGASPLLY